MKILYLDTEFDGFLGSLISIALVGEGDLAFYEVLSNSAGDPWVRKNVIPILNQSPTSIAEVQNRLEKFLTQFNAVTIIADWPEDIAQFCKLLITGPGTRIELPTLSFFLRPDLNSNESDCQHNALSDARAIMRMDIYGRGA